MKSLKVFAAGIGNNISALMQGLAYYESIDGEAIQPGIRNTRIGEFKVHEIDLVGGFDTQEEKIGLPLEQAIFCPPNNYIDLGFSLPSNGAVVSRGIYIKDGKISGHSDVVEALRNSGAEILLYSLPTGLQWAADAYAACALEAGVGLVNCTPEIIARNPVTLSAYEKAGLALIGDDLASHLGTSTLHRQLLAVLIDRGLTLDSTYQLNLGGNEDFRNLRNAGESKEISKKNALAQTGLDLDRVEVVPSAGHISSLNDRKVAHVYVSARGWANTEIRVDLKLEVQDSSNAAGVIIDLIRIAGNTQRVGKAGFNMAAASFLKSPPHGHREGEVEAEVEALHELNKLAGTVEA